jgi:AcrR family transcriptional regulator
MIAEGGPEGFTIRELGRRARVSVTTIYSTYGDKEGLIAAAIEDFYQRLPLARGPSPMTLPRLLEAIDEACKAVFGNKPYARHYVDLYFSGTVDPRIYKVIQDTARAAAGCQPWLQKTMRDGDTIAGFDMDYVMNLLTNNRLIGLQDWARGRIDDKQLAIEAKISFLSIVRGITRGATQDRVDAALKTCLRMATAARLQ